MRKRPDGTRERSRSWAAFPGCSLPLVPPYRLLRPHEPGRNAKDVARELGLTDVIELASNENPLLAVSGGGHSRPAREFGHQHEGSASSLATGRYLPTSSAMPRFGARSRLSGRGNYAWPTSHPRDHAAGSNSRRCSFSCSLRSCTSIPTADSTCVASWRVEFDLEVENDHRRPDPRSERRGWTGWFPIAQAPSVNARGN